MNAPNTHLAMDPTLSGSPLSLSEGKAEVELLTSPRMASDERGLVHGGFCFSLLDYAAMLAVNEPTVVLAKAEVKFLKPVVVGERLVASAEVVASEGKKRTVKAEVRRGEDLVLVGELLCVVPDEHVLTLHPAD